MNKLYEISFWLATDLKDDEVLADLQKIKDFIAGLSGQITKEKEIQKRKLAYPIKKAKQGYFGSLLFNADSDAIKALDKKLKLEDYVLRYLMIAVDKKYSAQMERQEEAIKEKFQKIIQPQKDAEVKKFTTPGEQAKIEEEIEKKLEEILK